MKQALHLRLGQSLTMTPQLQQAIRLLQLSSLELQTEIQEALDSNLMLEVEDESNDSQSQAEEMTSATQETRAEETSPETATASETDIPDELPVDSNWDDIYENISAPSSSPASSGDSDNREIEYSDSSSESLQQHLRWQMQLTPFSDTDRAIAEFIIDGIGDDGYLTMSVSDIYQALAKELEVEIEEDEVEAVLHRIQYFDPPGVAARNLQESLSLQLKQIPIESEWLNKAQRLVDEYFSLLAEREYSQLGKKLKVNEEELKEILQLIQSLNPRPGSQISSNQAEYIIPDVIVTKVKDTWRVELNPDAAPRLRINSQYANMVKQVKNSEDNNTMKNHLQEARWFIKSLLSRNETLLKVATSIVERQVNFFEHGDEAMKALVLHDIAEAVEMHESTISRVTSKKYMHTPRGIFELKYFFSSHVSTSDGGECSATAIRAYIKKLIAEEAPKKPFSDNKLAAILADRGINVARRTVAKYREAMAIPPSNERKRLA